MYLFSNFQYKLTVPKHGQVLDLCKSLGVKTGIAPEDVSEIFFVLSSVQYSIFQNIHTHLT